MIILPIPDFAIGFCGFLIPAIEAMNSLLTPAPATICGFGFGKNLTRLKYPVEAAVLSVLPICDQFVFVVGKSDDDTLDRVRGISPKVQVLESTWPDVKVDGTVLAIEANKALAAARATNCTWGFYIQADEVIHEDDLPLVRKAADHWASHPEVKALLFQYLHFVLDYQTTDPWMYHKASRLVRLDGASEIFGDACGPGIPNYSGPVRNGYLDKHHLGHHVQWAKDPAAGPFSPKARVFHYGWVKSKEDLDAKLGMVEKLWWGTLTEEEKNARKNNKFGSFIDRYPALKKFHGTHPAVMRSLIQNFPPFAQVPNRWLNPRFYKEVLSHGFKG